MNPKRRRRLLALIFMFTGIAVAIALALYALKQDINLFYTPTEVSTGKAPQGHVFRVGGLVEKGSLVHGNKDLTVRFTVTDLNKHLLIRYHGILPDLFREGQGIVAQGRLNKNGVFVADQVLAKHDERYMPPEAKEALERSAKIRKQRKHV